MPREQKVAPEEKTEQQIVSEAVKTAQAELQKRGIPEDQVQNLSSDMERAAQNMLRETREHRASDPEKFDETLAEELAHHIAARINYDDFMKPLKSNPTEYGGFVESAMEHSDAERPADITEKGLYAAVQQRLTSENLAGFEEEGVQFQREDYAVAGLTEQAPTEETQAPAEVAQAPSAPEQKPAAPEEVSKQVTYTVTNEEGRTAELTFDPSEINRNISFSDYGKDLAKREYDIPETDQEFITRVVTEAHAATAHIKDAAERQRAMQEKLAEQGVQASGDLVAVGRYRPGDPLAAHDFRVQKKEA